MTAILGISAFYHDAAAALVVDGEIVAAAQEERFSRKKHDAAFPRRAVLWCLAEAGLSARELDHVAFYDKPLLTFERLLETYVSFAPRGFRTWAKAMPTWLNQKLHLPREIRDGLGGEYRNRIVFTQHHESHAASAFFPSPFDRAAVLTVDGVGEWATATTGVGTDHRLELQEELVFPHSLGLLYSAFTYYTGFKVNSGEYKVMGLAPYGDPIYVDMILEHLVDLKQDGSFRLDLRYFDYPVGQVMTSRRFHDLFGAPPRQPEAPLAQRDMDLAASIQKVTEEIVVRIARHLHARTGLTNLCMAGGVALNCVANSRILEDTPFERLWVQPAAGDAGGALGAALFVWHQLLGNARPPLEHERDRQRGSLLGPRFEPDAVAAALDHLGARYHVERDEVALCDRVAQLIDEGNVVGWFQGQMEFGPRALGARSILGDPRDPAMQSVMNQKIKFRESFRPFAPAVLAGEAPEWFDLPAGEESPYMLLVAPVAAQHAVPVTQPNDVRGLAKLSVPRSEIPAVTHVDGSARLQTVDATCGGRFHLLLERFHRLAGCPVLINTSFNVRGEPIVCTPEDAYRCFIATDMDALVIGDALLLKAQQSAVDQAAVTEYLDQFELD